MFERYHSLEPDLKKMLVASLVFHGAILLVFTVKTTFFSSDIPKYEPVMRVDLIGLPEKRDPDKPVLAPAPEVVKETPKVVEKKVEEKKVDTKTSKTSQSAALQKLKAQSAIDKLKNLKEEAKPSDAKPTEVIKGNTAIQPGTSLKGLTKMEFDSYIGSLDAHVKNNWALPEWMRAQGLKAEVSIKLDKSGQIIERKLTKPSGNAEFDDRVMDALEKSNPFPAPPDKFIDLVGIQGITFAFPE